MIRWSYGVWIDEDGNERECVIYQALDEPEIAIDSRTGEKITGAAYKVLTEE